MQNGWDRESPSWTRARSGLLSVMVWMLVKSDSDAAMRLCLDCHRTIARGSRCARCQRAYRPRNVQAAWAAAVIARDGRCVDCGAIIGLEADHIVSLARGGGFTLENGAARCHGCHARRTTAQRRGEA